MPTPPPSNAQRIHNGPIIDLWQWKQAMFDGSTETFECVVRQDTVAVIPFLDADTVLLTKQSQPHRKPFIDVPGGRGEHGESALESAKRELLEETGYQGGRWLEWHRFVHAGLIRFDETLFIATDLQNTGEAHLDSGEKIELLPTPWSELVELCLARQLRQPNVMLAVLSMHFHPQTKQRLRDFLRG